jgi:hypothetical protein
VPYFFVIPVLILAVLAMSEASILCALVRRLRPAYPFTWRLLVWSSVGCLSAAGYLGGAILSMRLASRAIKVHEASRRA